MTTNSDIYERHARAVEFWRKACKDVELAERIRDETRSELDAISQELLAACADSGKPTKPVIRRGRRPKTDKLNGVDVRAIARENGKSLSEAHKEATQMHAANIRDLA